MSDNQMIRVKATIKWAFLSRPDNYDKFGVDLCDLSDAAVKALEDKGVVVKHKDENGFYIHIKSGYEIKIYDKNGTELDNTALGNGSKGEALLGTYMTKYKNKTWTQPSLKKLVITEYVKYEPKEQVDEVEDGEEAL